MCRRAPSPVRPHSRDPQVLASFEAVSGELGANSMALTPHELLSAHLSMDNAVVDGPHKKPYQTGLVSCPPGSSRSVRCRVSLVGLMRTATDFAAGVLECSS